MSEMPCSTAEMLLPDYADGRLDDAQAAKLRRHIDDCPACARQAERYRQLFQAVLVRHDETERLPDPGLFLSGINERLDRPTRTVISPHWRFPAAAATITAALLIVFAGLYYLGISITPRHGNALFPDLLTAEELGGIDSDVEIDRLLSDVVIIDLPPSDPYRQFDTADPATLKALESEIDIDLLDDAPYPAVLSAGFEYVSPYDVVEDIDSEEFESILNSIENNRITLL